MSPHIRFFCLDSRPVRRNEDRPIASRPVAWQCSRTGRTGIARSAGPGLREPDRSARPGESHPAGRRSAGGTGPVPSPGPTTPGPWREGLGARGGEEGRPRSPGSTPPSVFFASQALGQGSRSLSDRLLDRRPEERLSSWGSERDPAGSGAGPCRPRVQGPRAGSPCHKSGSSPWHGLPGRGCRPRGQDARADERSAATLLPSLEALQSSPSGLPSRRGPRVGKLREE